MGTKQANLCVLGKFPPIQGGVSRSNLWECAALIEAGHTVAVVTNAREVEPTYRTDSVIYRDHLPDLAGIGVPVPPVTYTDADWKTLHHIPLANPYVSKLAGLAADVVTDRGCDFVIGNYLEPYGVAAELVSTWTGVPYGLRHAGSDVGRLYRHDGLRQTFERIATGADFWLASARVGRGLRQLGVAPERLYPLGGAALPPTLFSPAADPLPLAEIIAESREQGGYETGRATVGLYGKIGITKGSFDLLHAVAELRGRGHRCNVVVVGDAVRGGADRMRGRATELGIADQLTVLPFLPPWGIPRFIAACDAVAFLERDFPIAIHRPLVPREVLAVGRCLLLSRDVARYQPYRDLLSDGENVLLVDPRDVVGMSKALEVVASDRARARAIGESGRRQVSERYENWDGYRAEISAIYERVIDDRHEREFSMSAAELQASFARLCADRPFRNWFRLEPDEALAGYRLTDEERAALESINTKLLDMFARSLLTKRRRYVTALFPHTRAVVPDEVTRLFDRFYELHPAQPGEGVTTQAQAFGRFLAASLATATDVPGYAADLARFETTRLEVRQHTVWSDRLEYLNDPPVTAREVTVAGDSVPRLAPGVRMLRLSHDIPGLIARLGEEPPPASLPPGERVLLWRPAAQGSDPDVFTINEATLRLLESCDGTRSLDEVSTVVPADADALERAAGVMARAGVLVV